MKALLLFTLIFPLVASAIIFLFQNKKSSIYLMTISSCLSFAFYCFCFIENKNLSFFQNWIIVDSLSIIFGSLISIIYFATSIYCYWYFYNTEERGNSNFSDASRVGILLTLFTAMNVVVVSGHLGIMWIAIEATTLASAPLVFYHKRKSALEATWKYLMISSIGITLALLGNFLLEVSIILIPEKVATLNFLISHVQSIDKSWLKIAFVFFTIGYGTKIGLAPMHTWKPDVYSEAPTPVAAIMSSALFSVAILGLIRILTIINYAGLGQFASEILNFFGIASLIISATFVFRQTNYRRMLAYSSVENAGFIMLALASGAVYGSLLHVFVYSMIKAVLFMVSGILVYIYGTKSVNEVTGVFKADKVIALFWLIGFLAITGFPPFGTFVSEFIIYKNLFTNNHYAIALLSIFFILIIYWSIAVIFLKMFFGSESSNHILPNLKLVRKSWTKAYVPIIFLFILSIIFGFFMPIKFNNLIQISSEIIQGKVMKL